MDIIWARRALLSGGWAEDVCVTVDQGRIQNIAVNTPKQGQSVGVLLPAPVNVHSHAFQRAMAGLTEARGPDINDNFWTWRKLMYRFLDQLTPEHIQAITALVQMEMLEAGYATNAEFHYLHHQPGGAPYDNLAEMSGRVAAAADQTGIGLCLLPVLYEFGGCDGRALTAGQIRFGNDFERFAKLHEGAAQAVGHLPDDAIIGVAPHSLRAVSQTDLQQIAETFDTGPIHMHLAEQLAEVDEVQELWGARPVDWALSNLQMDARWCLIHCTQMTAHETTRLAQTGATAGLCPITESNLGDGIFNGTSWVSKGGSLAIGSDSNIRVSLTEELRTLEYSQRLRDNSRAAFATPEHSTGRRLFEAIVKGGARATGRQSGAIEVGCWADLLAVDDASIHLENRTEDTVLDSWIFAGDDRLVRDVWSAGRHVVREGRHINHDAISNTYRTVQRSLMAEI
ncbi:formimidoylglutamate deiminase [Pseudaestuariivita rosea]|uniref:formimidoylglutamate deiminase n=1 Tax=Pseudaestuariivita rosea TaxID=2763263 RepID=UPI001ABA160F|nr:formimidoylglutamate deiminase [Pseudaestuariivita rosea]